MCVFHLVLALFLVSVYTYLVRFISAIWQSENLHVDPVFPITSSAIERASFENIAHSFAEAVTVSLEKSALIFYPDGYILYCDLVTDYRFFIYIVTKVGETNRKRKRRKSRRKFSSNSTVDLFPKNSINQLEWQKQK